MRFRPRRHAPVLSACGLVLGLTGCSGLKPYPNDLPVRNVSIRTTTSAGSMFSSVRAEVDVHGVDADCAARYLGTVALDRPDVAIGVPAGRRSRLTFHFLSSSLLGSHRSQISREVSLQPRVDQRYEIEVTYRDDLYDVAVRERVRGGVLREVQPMELAACRG
jgi:hypothetical protein